MGEAIARVEQLRNCFNRAIGKLEALPEIGLSNDGKPFIREVAEALQSFEAWFYNLTLDDMSLSGSARRVHVALNALDAIADWVGLHQSQQFAADIREHVGELVKQSEALDAAVLDAFTVKKTPNEVHRSKLRRVPQAKRDAIEDGIQSVASLAGHLGVRLQRIALMAGSTSEIRTGGSRGRVGRPPNNEALEKELVDGWLELAEPKPSKSQYIADRNAGTRKDPKLLAALNATHLRHLESGLRAKRRNRQGVRTKRR